MTELTKVCSKCGIEKTESEFYKRPDHRRGLMSWCKVCFHIHVKAYRRQTKNQVNSNQRKYHMCEKKFCQKIPNEILVELTCKVCGLKYGMLRSRYNFLMRKPDKDHPKYCSLECKHIGLSKKWQQTQSPYAKKINELQKEYK